MTTHICFVDMDGRASVVAEYLMRCINTVASTSADLASAHAAVEVNATRLAPDTLVLSRHKNYMLPPLTPIKSPNLDRALASVSPLSEKKSPLTSLEALTTEEVEATDYIITPDAKQRDLVLALCPQAKGKCYTLGELVGMEDIVLPRMPQLPKIKLTEGGMHDRSVQEFLKQGLGDYLIESPIGTTVAMVYIYFGGKQDITMYAHVEAQDPLRIRVSYMYPGDDEDTYYWEGTLEHIMQHPAMCGLSEYAFISPEKSHIPDDIFSSLRRTIAYRNAMFGQVLALASMLPNSNLPSVTPNFGTAALAERIQMLEHEMGSCPTEADCAVYAKTICTLAKGFLEGKHLYTQASTSLDSPSESKKKPSDTEKKPDAKDIEGVMGSPFYGQSLKEILEKAGFEHSPLDFPNLKEILQNTGKINAMLEKYGSNEYMKKKK